MAFVYELTFYNVNSYIYKYEFIKTCLQIMNVSLLKTVNDI